MESQKDTRIMNIKKGVVVTIINKNYPPSKGITGQSANELATYLIQQGVQVNVVCTTTAYQGGVGDGVEAAGRVYSIKSIYGGKNNIVRLIASFIEAFLLIRKAKKTGRGGWFIVMTDPPFLNLWAALLFGTQKWILWTMDLYPQAFASANLVSVKNPLYKLMAQEIKKAPPSAMINLGEWQKQYMLDFYKESIPTIILPCGIWEPAGGLKGEVMHPAWYAAGTSKYIGYCGNLGEAHSLEFILAALDRFDKTKFKFILSVYGTHAKQALAHAAQTESVIIVDNVKREHLHLIDMHLVTLKEIWNHVCVPSKAFSAVCSGSAILFCGNEANDNWHYLKDAAWIVKDDAAIDSALESVLNGDLENEIALKRAAALRIRAELLSLKGSAFEGINKIITNT